MLDPVIADSFVSLAAVVGLLTLRSTLKQDGDDAPINSRFLFGINVVCTMMVARVLSWTTGFEIFDVITVIAAGLIPLATLLLCEGLLQRHAPAILKWIAALGAGVFFVLAFFSRQYIDPGRVMGLLAFQGFIFICAGYLVVTRDKTSLSTAENQSIERIALSLLLIVPFAISDYRTGFFDTPVRMSGVAVLFLCWLAISLRRSNLHHGEIFRSFFLLLGSAVAAGVSIAWLADIDLRTMVQIIAIITSATIVAVIYNDSRSLQRDEERDSLLRYLARSNLEDPDSFLRGLLRHEPVTGALVLEEKDLADFDESFREAFRKEPFKRVSDSGTTDTSGEQVRWFFEKYDATHALMVSDRPFAVMALNIPAFAASPNVELELQTVQRMAQLISRRKAEA